ncbi:hypothetical protein [Bacillus sp. FJAT-45350]|uniref:hypothetical protein n=1 Tax=Bacillus sp. FJAT-45350 TaxID=2011014 RepID=UPI000BB81185|nr:hypothetical protein [Bacillus sp. FJAT-45350]
MKLGFIRMILLSGIVIILTFAGNETYANSIKLYIDGQPQTYFGQVVEENGEMFLPLRPVMLSVERRVAKETEMVYGLSMEQDYLENIENDIQVQSIRGRDMITLAEAEKLGFESTFYNEEQVLHVSSSNLLTVADIEIGMSRQEVNEILGTIHWNTVFSKQADYIGFYGEMHSYMYVDRYGYERRGEVPDIQIEIIDGTVSYVIVSSPEYLTSKGVSVGDNVSTLFRTYGTSFVREYIDGKEVYIYDVEQGSIWFIANQNREIERIGYWDHWMRGF